LVDLNSNQLIGELIIHEHIYQLAEHKQILSSMQTAMSIIFSSDAFRNIA